MRERIIHDYMMGRRRGVSRQSNPAEKAMLRPDTKGSGDESDCCQKAWIPTEISNGSRRPAARSRGSCRGSIVDPASNRELVYESLLERTLAYMLVTDRRVAKIEDQPVAVKYLTDEGRIRRHTFDFRATTTSGKRIAFAVKPSKKVGKSGVAEIVKLIEKQTNGSFADVFLIRTEKHLTSNRSFNARLIHRARKARNSADVAQMADIVAKTRGAILIEELVRISGEGACAFNAVVCLIDEGALKLVSAGRIDYGSFVSRCQGKDTPK